MEDLAEYLETVNDNNTITFLGMLLQFVFNLVFVAFVTHFLYYRKSKRLDYYFTFILISTAVFMVVYLMSSVKMKTGFALGLFAVFGIMRYRTESIPVREMTYLFVLIALSVMNALGRKLSIDLLYLANFLIVSVIYLAERLQKGKPAVKYIKYDRIELCKTSKMPELVEDIENRLEIKVVDISIGNVNFLKDMAILRVQYIPAENQMTEDNRIEELE